MAGYLPQNDPYWKFETKEHHEGSMYSQHLLGESLGKYAVLLPWT